jgi:hypothetical protein
LVQVTVVPALIVAIAGEYAKFSIDTTLVATGASGIDAMPGITGPGAGAASALVGPPPQPATIATPAAADAAAITSLVLYRRMMIDPVSAENPADAGLTSR